MRLLDLLAGWRICDLLEQLVCLLDALAGFACLRSNREMRVVLCRGGDLNQALRTRYRYRTFTDRRVLACLLVSFGGANLFVWLAHALSSLAGLYKRGCLITEPLVAGAQSLLCSRGLLMGCFGR